MSGNYCGTAALGCAGPQVQSLAPVGGTQPGAAVPHRRTPSVAAVPWKKTKSVPPLRLSIINETAFDREPFLRRCLRRAHAMLGPRIRELSLALVGDKTMSRLHRQFLNITGPTDVLTFALATDARGHSIAGEVIVCVPEARRNARSRGIPLEREVLLYALHGMLHLCGYDDRTERGFRRMHRVEDELLSRLGIGPVFSHPER